MMLLDFQVAILVLARALVYPVHAVLQSINALPRGIQPNAFFLISPLVLTFVFHMRSRRRAGSQII